MEPPLKTNKAIKLINIGGLTYMKIRNITNPVEFFQVLNKCKGKVILTTEEGDELNMKSKLCQYIAISKMFSEAKIKELELLVSEPEDLTLLLQYLVRG
jgi:hypothetical protein